jgi:hypothetical protein
LRKTSRPIRRYLQDFFEDLADELPDADDEDDECPEPMEERPMEGGELTPGAGPAGAQGQAPQGSPSANGDTVMMGSGPQA